MKESVHTRNFSLKSTMKTFVAHVPDFTMNENKNTIKEEEIDHSD